MMQVMVQWKEYVVTSALVFGCTESTSEILLGHQQCLQCSSAECGSVEDMETIVQVISVNENPVIRLLQISSLSDKKNHWFHCRLFCKTIEWTQSPWRWPALRRKMRLSETKGSLADDDTNFIQTFDPTTYILQQNVWIGNYPVTEFATNVEWKIDVVKEKRLKSTPWYEDNPRLRRKHCCHRELTWLDSLLATGWCRLHPIRSCSGSCEGDYRQLRLCATI